MCIQAAMFADGIVVVATTKGVAMKTMHLIDENDNNEEYYNDGDDEDGQEIVSV
jgi:hypothetical protein